MWKRINKSNNKEEKIYNTLLIYYEGEFQKEWSKHYISYIDGFKDKYHNTIKDKIGESTDNSLPVVTFNGLSFTYDICLDFCCGKHNTCPLSTELCESENIVTDINVLIASGMPIYNKNYISKINSDTLLRCDGQGSSYCEILSKNRAKAKENTPIIECLETYV